MIPRPDSTRSVFCGTSWCHEQSGNDWRLTHALRDNWTLVPVPPSLHMELQLLEVEMETGDRQSLALARYLLNVRAPLDAKVQTNSIISVKVQVSPPPISVLTDNILLVGPCHLPKILVHQPLMWLSTSHHHHPQLTLAKIAQFGRYETVNIRGEHYSPRVVGSIPVRAVRGNFFAEFTLL